MCRCTVNVENIPSSLSHSNTFRKIGCYTAPCISIYSLSHFSMVQMPKPPKAEEVVDAERADNLQYAKARGISTDNYETLRRYFSAEASIIEYMWKYMYNKDAHVTFNYSDISNVLEDLIRADYARSTLDTYKDRLFHLVHTRTVVRTRYPDFIKAVVYHIEDSPDLSYQSENRTCKRMLKAVPELRNRAPFCLLLLHERQPFWEQLVMNFCIAIGGRPSSMLSALRHNVWEVVSRTFGRMFWIKYERCKFVPPGHPTLIPVICCCKETKDGEMYCCIHHGGVRFLDILPLSWERIKRACLNVEGTTYTPRRTAAVTTRILIEDKMRGYSDLTKCAEDAKLFGLRTEFVFLWSPQSHQFRGYPRTPQIFSQSHHDPIVSFVPST